MTLNTLNLRINKLEKENKYSGNSTMLKPALIHMKEGEFEEDAQKLYLEKHELNETEIDHWIFIIGVTPKKQMWR